MPRKPRRFRPDSIFHIGCRGVDRQPIFLTDHDRLFFRNAMLEAIDDSDASEAAHCLMPNHFHWAIATRKELFDRMVHSVMTRHAVRFNRLYSRTGHLFEDRHWSFLCEDIEHIENAMAYIHLNPVRAKLVRSPSDWKWSSHAAWLDGQGRDVDFGRLSEITGKRADVLRANHDARVAAELSGRARGLQADALVADVASLFGMPVQALSSSARGDIYTTAKRILLERAKLEKVSVADLARALKCDPGVLYVLGQRKP
jgi:REP element-mobilizing transposase RayT